MTRRLINRRPDRAGLVAWGALPFLIAIIAYFIFSTLRLADNPNDKLLPGLATLRALRLCAGFRPGCAHRPDPALGRHVVQPAPAGHGAGGGDRVRAGLRHRDRHHPLYPGRAFALHRRAVDDPAHGGPADPVHRLRPRRAVPGGTDHGRHYAVPDPRPGASGRRAAAGAVDQGADARRLDLADHPARGAAADCAPAARRDPGCRSGRPGCS